MSSNISQKLLHVLITMGLILSVSGLSASDAALKVSKASSVSTSSVSTSSVPRPPSAFVRTAQLPSELASAVVPVAARFYPSSQTSVLPVRPPMPVFRPAPPEIVSLAAASTAVFTAGDRVASVSLDSSYYSEYPGCGYLRDSLLAAMTASPRPSSPDRWYR